MSSKPCKPLVLLFFCFHICFGTALLAQSTALPQVIPPSPTSREYDKYINYPVTLYNGVPEISVPLYSLKVGSISIPVSLNYHASGIKYGQNSGEVGVGWVLEPGYRISRTINGRPDELFPKPEVGDLNESSFGSKELRDTYLSQFIRWEEQNLPVPSQLSDGEYDLFTYSMPSQSGTFVIEDRQAKKIRQISHSNLSINYNQLTDKSVNYFELKDGNGIKYTTGPIENNSNMGYVPIPPTAWVLANIDDPFGNYARFSYTTYNETAQFTPATFLAHSGTNGSNLSCPDDGSAILSQNPPYPYYVQRISEIETNESIVAFNRNAISGFLNNIEVKNKQNQTLRKIQFYYSSLGAHTFLDSIKIYGTDMVKAEVYKFHYYGKDIGNYDLLHDFVQDYWGYYKRKPSTGINFPDFGFYALCRPSDGQLYDLYNYGLRGNNRNVEPYNDAVYFTLDKITYPTGGSTTYEYEPNRYLGFNDDAPTTLTTKYAGIRVHKISSNDLVNGKTLIKRYAYGNNEDGLGKVHIDIASNRYFVTERPNYVCTLFDAMLGTPADVKASKELLFSTDPNAELSSGGFIGAPVQYEKVVEYSEDYTPYKTSGKTEYTYEVPSEPNWYGYNTNTQYRGFLGINRDRYAYCYTPAWDWTTVEFSDYYISGYQTWNTPVLKDKSFYKLESDSYQLVLKEVFQYNITGVTNFMGLKVRRFFSAGANPYSPDFYLLGISSIFNFSTYEVSIGNKVLSEKTTTTYDGAASIEQKTKYYYNADFQLNREESWNSDGSVTSITSKYPVDYGNITATDNVSAGVKKLQDAHVLNAWVEKIKERNASSNRLVDAFFQVYKTDKPLPDKLLKAESTSPLINFNQSVNNNGAISFDAHYQPRIHFNTYDSHGNILEQQNNSDVKEVYFWGYNSQYPVAKIIGSDYNTAKAFINQSVLDNVNGSYTDAQMRTELDKLRANLPNAFVTTYTYAPLKGITSVTDPRGKTMFYEYDAFARLNLIRDQDQNILKKFCYNYAGQQSDCEIVYNSQDYSGYYYSMTCPDGTTPNEIYVSMPAGSYTSTISLQDANWKAQEAAQNYANANGRCRSGVNIYYTTGSSCYVEFYNTGLGTYYYFYWTPGSNNFMAELPVGTYNITFYGDSGWHNCSSSCDGSNTTGSGTVTLYSVAIDNSCNAITISFY